MARRPRNQQLAEQFGERVRAERNRRGLSQEKFAEAAGLHRTYVGAIENGRVMPTLETAVLVAVALGIDLVDLVKGLDRVRVD